jgi:glycosyltransferase involved in cell wall biosynthesis
MISGKKVVVVMPAYNAEKTLEKTYQALPHDIVDHVVVVDDASGDRTIDVAKELNIAAVVRHPNNLGYGANQKSCYKKALELEADVVVMVHPDYQYDPRLVTAMSSMIASGVYDCVIASRILGTGALKGGMPIYKYIANRLLTAYQNFLIPFKLSEYHSGYRAFSRDVLQTLPLDENSDDFIFDNQMLVQVISQGFSMGEVSCPTRYLADSSSISIARSIRYGLAVLVTTLEFKLSQIGILKSDRFPRTTIDRLED